MSNAVLDAIREKYPAYAEVPDDELTQAIGRKFPVYRQQDASFNADYLRAELKPGPDVGRFPGGPGLEVEAPVEPEGGVIRRPDQSGSRGARPSEIDPSSVMAFPGVMAPLPAGVSQEMQRQAFAQQGVSVIDPDPSLRGLTTPIVSVRQAVPDLPAEVSENLPTVAKAGYGVAKGVASTVDFFLSPLGIATLGIGALPRTGQQIIAGAFAADMARHTPDIAAQLGQALGEGDTERAAEFATVAALNTFFTAKSAKHALGQSRGDLARMVGQQLSKRIAPDVRKGTEMPAEPGAGVTPTPGPLPFGREIEPASFAEALAKEPLDVVKEQADFFRRALANPGYAERFPNHVELGRIADAELHRRTAATAPKPVLRRAPADRPWDVIDEYEAQVGGKINLTQAQKLIENFKPVGAARKLFTRTGGFGPDVAKEGVSTFKTFEDDVAFLESINDAAAARKGAVSQAATEKRVIKQQEAQRTEFEPKSEPINVTELLIGDEFELAKTKVKVKDLVFDPDTAELAYVVLEDGNRFEVQTVGAGQEMVGEVLNLLRERSSGTSSVGFPMQATSKQIPVALDRDTKRSVAVPKIMEALERVIKVAGGESPIRTGHFFAKALGIFKPREETIRLGQADDIATATHEVGHALQKQIFGSSKSKALGGFPAEVKRELVSLGHKLYPNSKPSSGYTSEGFVEFIRHWLTRDDSATVAPNTHRFFEQKILPLHPEITSSLRDARALIDIYRQQGSIERARQQVIRSPGYSKRLGEVLKNVLGAQAQIEEFNPLQQMAKMAAGRLGRPLRLSEDPYEVASAKRGTAGAVLRSMVERGMQDLWGVPTGVKGLREALAPVSGQRDEFQLYLYGRAAIERWSQGRNPGISLEDARFQVQHFDSPKFQIAARDYYKWSDGILDYVAQANPALADSVANMRAKNKNYVPLSRFIDPAKARRVAAQGAANPFFRFKGSGLPVKDIFESTLQNAGRMISMAHRNLVLRTVVNLSRHEGMGFLVEELPRNRVRNQVPLDHIRKQLEDLGLDTAGIPEGELINYYSLAPKPSGSAPIIPFKDAQGKVRWFEVQPEVYELLAGMDHARLPAALDLVFGAPARAFRLGTTGLRPSFSLLTNPLRDLPTYLMQSRTGNPARLVANYFGGMARSIMGGITGKESAIQETFQRLGAQVGQPLGMDIAHTRLASKELFEGRIMRKVRHPIEHLRELLSIPEAGPRLAELMNTAREINWTPGTPMTPDQSIALALAAKRATVDFSAAGRISRVINQAVPFYNVAIQGTRSLARAFQQRPARTVLYGLTALTIPTLLNWWRNKDKEWYRNLPWRERYQYDNIEDGPNVWQIPRSIEWGVVFQVVPEALLDAWHREDPRGVKEALGYMFDVVNPADYPVLGKIAKEQWQNRIDFFDRPIVPRGEVELPPGEQLGPYTSKFAALLGRAFPNRVSPRRVDAALRGYFGGVAPDLMQTLGLGAARKDREFERSDVPVFGRVSRRGGEFSSASQHMADFYDKLDFYRARSRAKVNPPTPQETVYTMALEGYNTILKATREVIHNTRDGEALQRLHREMSQLAQEALKLEPKKK